MLSEKRKSIGILIPESGGDAGLSAYKLLFESFIMNAMGMETVSIDSDYHSPSMGHLHFYKVPYATDTHEYMKTITTLIERHNIKIVLPTGDFDPKTLASYRLGLLEMGCILAMSEPDVYELWEDKLKFFLENPNVVAQTTDHPSLVNGQYPIFAKPRYGVGSRGLRVLHDSEEAIDFAYREKELYVYQPLLEGEQFTVDVLCSLDGQPLQAVTRKVYRLKGGADVVCQVIQSHSMERIAMELCKKYGVIGAACFEFMFDDHGNPLVIDAQPRLSGGHTVTARAGLNIPSEIVNMVMGGTFEKKEINYVKVIRTLGEVIL